MGAIIDIVLPVFGLIGLGYLSVRTRLLSETAGDEIAGFVFKIAVPILLFRLLATAEFSSTSPWAYWGAYFCGIAVAWAGATAIVAGIIKRGYRASVIAGVAAGFSNLVLFGIPLIERAYGSEGLTILFVLISIHLPIMMTISTFLMEHAARADGAETSRLDIKSVAQNLVRNLAVNPIIIGIAAGLVWRFAGPGLGGPLAQILELLGKTAGPLALFSLGMGLIKYGIKGNIVPGLAISSLSLIVMPAVVYVLGSTVFNMPALWFKVAVLAACCPTGVNAYLFATHFKTAEGLASNTIVLALLGSIITVPIWIAILST